MYQKSKSSFEVRVSFDRCRETFVVILQESIPMETTAVQKSSDERSQTEREDSRESSTDRTSSSTGKSIVSHRLPVFFIFEVFQTSPQNLLGLIQNSSPVDQFQPVAMNFLQLERTYLSVLQNIWVRMFSESDFGH